MQRLRGRKKKKVLYKKQTVASLCPVCSQSLTCDHTHQWCHSILACTCALVQPGERWSRWRRGFTGAVQLLRWRVNAGVEALIHHINTGSLSPPVAAVELITSHLQLSVMCPMFLFCWKQKGQKSVNAAVRVKRKRIMLFIPQRIMFAHIFWF